MEDDREGQEERSEGCHAGEASSKSMGVKPSEKEKEKTKLRERQRRAITTKIFSGLRKHGGYNLPPRADINDVLRALAHEAGWIVDPDGTTHRSKLHGVGLQINERPHQQASGSYGLQPSGRESLTAGGGSMAAFATLPAITTDFIDSRTGDCSTTASPRHSDGSLLHNMSNSPFTSPASSDGAPCSVRTTNAYVGGYPVCGYLPCSSQIPLKLRDRDAFAMKEDHDLGSFYLVGDVMDLREVIRMNNIPSRMSDHVICNVASQRYEHTDNIPATMMMQLSQHQPFLQESKASNQNTPLGSPQRPYRDAI